MEPLPTPGNLQPLSSKQIGENHSLQLTKEQKIGLAVLGTFTLLIIIFWFAELNKNLTYPFYGGMSKGNFEAKVASNEVSQATVDATKKDTDSDGLTDTEELTVYNTSPFLADTDGDGLTDGDEVKNNTNPNCPEGKECTTDGMVIGTEQIGSGTSTVDLFNAGSASQTNVANSVTAPLNQGTVQPLDSASANSLLQAFGTNPDPKYLREQLIKSATKQEDKDALQKISDADLLQMYKTMTNQP